MSTFLYGLGHAVARHRWRALIIWVLLAAICFGVTSVAKGAALYDAFAPDAAQKSRGDSLAPALLVFITFVYVTAAGIGRVSECGFFLS